MKTEVKQLINSLSEIFKSIHQRSYHKVDNKNFYPGQPRLLSLIKENDGITQKDLSEKSFVTPATITGMLIKLEANSYIYRIPDETDKRIMRVYLTDEGRNFTDKCEKYMAKMVEQLFDGFTAEELETFSHLVNKVKANIYKD
jgi:DNA-binding MarR family transcriptional regulator